MLRHLSRMFDTQRHTTMPIRVCACCKIEKSITEFYRDNSSSSGYGYWCKSCSKIRRQENRERNIEHAKETQKAYYESHKEQHKKSHEQWKINNPGKMNEYNKKYRDNNRDKVRLSVRKSQIKNIDRVKESIRSWFKNNPGKIKEYGQNRRARLLSAEGTFSDKEWEELLRKYDYSCLKCGRKDVKLTLDHVVPLSEGGRNSIDNIQPLCGACNSSKGTKTIDYRIATCP